MLKITLRLTISFSNEGIYTFRNVMPVFMVIKGEIILHRNHTLLQSFPAAYCDLSDTTGSLLAALFAGSMPKINPTAMDMVNETTMESGEIMV